MKKSKLNLYKIIFLLLSSFTINLSNAQMTGGASGVMDVSTTVTPVCNIETSNISDIKLDYDPSFNRNKNYSIYLNYTCTKGTSFNIKLDGGQSYDGSYRNLKSINSQEKIKYYLSAFPPNTTIFSGTGVGTKAIHTFPFYLLSRQNVPAGTFTDTIIITFEY